MEVSRGKQRTFGAGCVGGEDSLSLGGLTHGNDAISGFRNYKKIALIAYISIFQSTPIFHL